ncbi:MAG: hypothetical protein PHO27_10565 [Sulfuricurvum sp.]|nr:hypothetical protein [Sulfuricurvum sp.]
MNKIKYYFLISIFALKTGAFYLSAKNNLPQGYKGDPFKGSINTKGAQVIRGCVECKYFDLVGEGVAYPDKDSLNNVSGPYNYQFGRANPVPNMWSFSNQRRS